MVATLFPLRGRNRASLLVVQINSAFFAETQRVGPRRDTIHAETLADVVEEDVTRFHDRSMEGDLPMTLLAPAAIFPIAEPYAARTIVGRRRRQSSGFQSGYAIDD